MNMVRYNPWSIFDELNQALKDIKGEHSLGVTDSSNVETSHWVPAIDIKETPEAFILFADLPGVDSKNIEVSMDDSVLTVKGKRNFETKSETGTFTRTERVSGTFYRRFTLPNTADSHNISAKYKSGVLELTIPKQEKAQPRRISVESYEV